MTTQLHIRALGGFDVLRNGAPIAARQWGTHRAKSVFKLLLGARGAPLTKEHICDSVWPGASPAAAQRDLYTAVSDLRRLLEPGLRKPADSAFVLSTDSGYRLRLDGAHAYDVRQFEDSLAAARAHLEANEVGAAVTAFCQAEACYQGDYLPDDVFADWSTRERERLRLLFMNALLESADAHARLGKYRQAIARCRRALELDNCLETAYRALMAYQFAAGDRAQAMRVYAECQAVLEKELRVAPAPATRELAEQIRASALDRPAQAPAADTTPRQGELPLSLGNMPFVGRAAEIDTLRRAAEAAKNGQGGLCLVIGPSGVGKSALVAHALRDRVVARAQAHELTQTLDYHLVIELIQQAIGLDALRLVDAPWRSKLAAWVPALAVAGKADTPNANDSRQQLFDAFRQCLLSVEPGTLLLLEDLQWADDPSLEVLALCAPYLAQSSLLIVATARPAERLSAFRSHSGRVPWLRELTLKPLREAEVVDMVAAFAPDQSDLRALGLRLYRAAGGNPLFVASILLTLFESGQLWRMTGGQWGGIRQLLAAPVLPVPDEMAKLVAQRASTLTVNAGRLLMVAAVLESARSFETLRQVFTAAFEESPASEAALLDAVDELCAVDLLRADSGGRLSFTHDALREATYAGLSAPRRAQLHRCAGQLLEAQAPENIAQLAHHYGRADDADKAIAYLVKAGALARDRFSARAALIHFERALALIREHGPDRWRDERLTAEIGRAGVAYDLGLADVEREAIDALKALISEIDQPEQINAVIRLAYLLSDTGQYKEVLAITDQLRARFGADTPWRAQLLVWRVRGYAFWELGHAPDMVRCFDNCLEATRLGGIPAGLVWNWAFLSLAHSYGADWARALHAATRVDALRDTSKDPYIALAVDEAMAEVWMALGLWREAEAAIQRATRIGMSLETDRPNANLALLRGQLLLSTQPAAAQSALAHALELAHSQQKHSIGASARIELAQLAARGGELDRSRAHFDAALSTLTETGSEMKLTCLRAAAIFSFLDAGQVEDARRYAAGASAAPFNKHTLYFQAAQARLALATGDAASAKTRLSLARQALLTQADAIADPDSRAAFLAHPQSRLIL